MEEFFKNKIVQWNHLFPLDRWWRKKHGISLYSEEHLNANQLYLTLEFLEDKMFKKFRDEEEKRKVVDLEEEAEGLLKTIVSTNDESMFENLDVAGLNLKVEENE